MKIVKFPSPSPIEEFDWNILLSFIVKLNSKRDLKKFRASLRGIIKYVKGLEKERFGKK